MIKFFVFAAFSATMPFANWLIGNVGTVCVPQGPCLIPVGFGLMAPTGVLMIGLALVLRDWLHEIAGASWALAAIAVGVVLSFLTSPPPIAIASALAFSISEIADFAVYSKLRERGKALAVMASQVVGAVIDSAVFVFVAFGSLEFSAGTTIAKVYAGLFVAILLAARNRYWCREAYLDR